MAKVVLYQLLIVIQIHPVYYFLISQNLPVHFYFAPCTIYNTTMCRRSISVDLERRSEGRRVGSSYRVGIASSLRTESLMPTRAALFKIMLLIAKLVKVD